MTISFSIGLRHILEDCLKALRGRPLDPGRRTFALERGLGLVSRGLRAHEAVARATGIRIEASDEELDAYRFVREHGGGVRSDLGADLRAAAAALSGLLQGGVAVAARDIAAAEDLLSTVLAAGMMAEASRAMETI